MFKVKNWWGEVAILSYDIKNTWSVNLLKQQYLQAKYMANTPGRIDDFEKEWHLLVNEWQWLSCNTFFPDKSSQMFYCSNGGQNNINFVICSNDSKKDSMY